jgi:3-oxoisoapionate decarboxylase
LNRKMPLLELQRRNVAAGAGGVDSVASEREFAGTSLGLVTYCLNIAAKNFNLPGVPDVRGPTGFITEAARIGASAVQISYGILGADERRMVRDLAERLGIGLEATVNLPKGGEADLAKFEREMETLRELGVPIARTVLLPGRRYEQFKSILDYAQAMRVGIKALSDAEKVARRTGVRLALENHKDQTLEERLALLEQFSSEWIGVTLDVGNNIALLEDPVETARAFAPWTLTVHFKDQGVREYENGFLLADVPVGEGVIDLPAVIQVIRAKKPEVRFHLELITRDPLKIPYLRDDYWATLDEVKARELGGTLAMLKGRAAKREFPLVSKMSAAEQVREERENIERSLRYAAEKLGFGKR